MSPRRMLQIAGTAELVTLILMLANMLTVHAPAISQVLGPLQGLAYMATVITAILVRGDRHIVWVLSLIPGIGGLLAPAPPPPSNSIGTSSTRTCSSACAGGGISRSTAWSRRARAVREASDGRDASVSSSNPLRRLGIWLAQRND